jgi:spore coat polysaccharide biosynthesis protein SpsF (cytidylyltransferase family)
MMIVKEKHDLDSLNAVEEKPHVLALVAVRLKSSRCPRKGIADLAGKPLILRLNERIEKAEYPERIIWCTSVNPQDDPLETLAQDNNVEIFRGDEMDVLSRFIAVAEKHHADHIIRITGDNPLTDPDMMDFMVEKHIEHKAEYTFVAENDMPRGTRVEVMSVPALKKCAELAQDLSYSEYMTLMFRREDFFNVYQVEPPMQEIKRGDIRLTVDTPEDLKVVQAVYENFNGSPPPLADVIRWIDDKPEIKAINQRILPSEISEDINVRLMGD